MRAAIAANNPIKSEPPVSTAPDPNAPTFNPAVLSQKTPPEPEVSDAKATLASQIPKEQLPSNPMASRDRLIELSKNKEFTIATIAKEPKRKSGLDDKDEVYISLH